MLLLFFSFFPFGIYFSDRVNLKLSHYHIYFGAAVKKWLSVARSKIHHRIQYSIEKSNPKLALTSSSNTNFTTSSLDISNCFTQMSQFWRRLGIGKKNSFSLKKENVRIHL